MLQFQKYQNEENLKSHYMVIGGECAQAIQNEYVFEHNQPTINVVMEIKKANGGFSNHAFNQSGISPRDPKTWGKRIHRYRFVGWYRNEK